MRTTDRRRRAGQPAQGSEKGQVTVELRLLPGPSAPWRRLWDWLLAPVPEPDEGAQTETQLGEDASANEGEGP